MITFDGHRSMLRKPFAAKKLATLHDLDLPAQTLLWNGFRVKVWQQGEIDGGRVTAPMGAVVGFGTENGGQSKVQIAVSEYFRGGFVSVKDAHSVYFPAEGDDPLVKVFNYVDEETFIADGNSTVQFIPMGSNSPFGLVNDSVGALTEWHRDLSGVPGIMPDKYQESFWLTLDNNVFIDLNENGTADFPKYIIDRSRLFYIGDGSHVNNRATVSLQVGGGEEMAGAVQPWRVIQHLDQEWQAVHDRTSYQVSPLGRKICVRNWGPVDFLPYDIYLDQLIPSGASGFPGELRAIMLSIVGATPGWPLGNYTWGTKALVGGEPVLLQSLLHVANLTNTLPWTGDSPTEEFFDNNPTEAHWKLFYSFYVNGTVSMVSSSQFLSLLDSLADVSITGATVHWSNARRMLNQLLPWPNNNFSCPYDSIMFHGHDGNVYTWTRKYGPVKFTPTGLYTTSLAIPGEVTAEDGVRPEITHAGDGLYLCVCNKPKDRVPAVYFGSPFESWVKLPGLPAPLLDGRPEPTLIHVRPVRVTLEDIFLIGVLKDTAREVIGEVEQDVERYFFSSLRWRVTNGGATTVPWQRHGKLPFDVAENDNFSVGLYGNDPLVKDLANYPSPPSVLPQMPVGPYHLYALGQP